ncbi:hypothetical protein OH77DRAFT_1457020 [Trametes cingulata]|nr:hypothetical protein OH77DRAFT_1457020 [Trametes cingulata]
MIADDAMELCHEPDSSQPFGIPEWNAHVLPKARTDDLDFRVEWVERPSSNPALRSIIRNCRQVSSERPAPPPPALVTAQPARASRRPGNANHPAHKPRHAVVLQDTQDPEVHEAKRQFDSIARHAIDYSLHISKRKAAKMDPAHKENRSSASSTTSTTLQRRHTAGDIQAPLPLPRSRAALKSRSTEPSITSAAGPSDRSEAMDEDMPVPGPSKPTAFRRPSLTDFVNASVDDEDDEDAGTPSSTPTPPPKQRIPQRSVSSASSSSSASKGKARQFTAFSESPTSVCQAPLTRRHSIDPSASYSTSLSQSISPVEQRPSSQGSQRGRDCSPVIPSPLALAQQSASAMMPPPPAPSFQPPPPPPSTFVHSEARSQSPVPQHSQAPAPSRLPPSISHSPALSRPYILPSSTPGPSQVRPLRASQRGPPVLGMRPIARTRGTAAGKYQVPKAHPKAIAGFTVPFKNRPVNANGVTKGPDGGGVAVSSSGAGPESGLATGASRSGLGGVARTTRGSSTVVPEGHANATTRPLATEMSARRPEPQDAMDEGKEADSSYGDIPFDFDLDALDEAMSMYDG